MNPAIGVDLHIIRLTGRGGALIGGVKKLGPDLHPATVSAIRSALLEHKVIFFRDQQHLTDAAQEAFAKLLGELVPQPTIPSVDGTDVVLELDSAHGGRADSWHTDVTFVAAYPMASVLRGRCDLPKQAATRSGRIPRRPTRICRRRTPASPTSLEPFTPTRTTMPPAGPRSMANPASATTRYSLQRFTKPSILRCACIPRPAAARSCSVISSSASSAFRSMTARKIFELLQSHATLEENTIRWRWRTGDVAIWDNRATQHKAINDYGDARRIVHRVTIAGDVPVGVDGRPSESRVARENPAARRAA